MRPLHTAACALLVLIAGTFTASGGAPEPATSGSSPAQLTAREAGTRYGQAAGVALVCYGLKTTTAAEELKSRYAGSNLDAFNDQAERILAAWRETLTCRKAAGPNECRLSHEWSCRDALREIGPLGSVLPGLVEVKSP